MSLGLEFDTLFSLVLPIVALILIAIIAPLGHRVQWLFALGVCLVWGVYSLDKMRLEQTTQARHHAQLAELKSQLSELSEQQRLAKMARHQCELDRAEFGEEIASCLVTQTLAPASGQQQVLPILAEPKPLTGNDLDGSSGGWIYLGEFDPQAQRWGQLVLSHRSSDAPQSLINETFKVSNGGVNMRNGVGVSAPVKSFLGDGARLRVAELRPLQHRYYWAKVELVDF